MVRDSGIWRSDGKIPNSGVISIWEDKEWKRHPFTVSFTKERRNGDYVAVADNEGYVGIYNTTFPFPEGNRTIKQWLAHRYSIFDISWIKEDAFMLTSSEDETIKLWDIERTIKVGEMKGPNGHVRSLSVNPTQPDIFVSGSGDGSIAIWDIRTPAGVRSDPNCWRYSPVEKAVDKAPAFQNSITAVLYLKDATGVVSGRSDRGLSEVYQEIVESMSNFLCAISYWDTRNLTAPFVQTPPEVPEGYIWKDDVEGEDGLYGIASLSLDPTGTRLLAACADSTIYMYDAMGPDRGALRKFSGHTAENFLVKAAFSPDGSYVLSGSEDNDAFIWKVDDPSGRPTRLKGHEAEVAGVSWSQNVFCKVATTSFDNKVRVWSMSEPKPESDSE